MSSQKNFASKRSALKTFGNLVQEGSMPEAPKVSGLVKDILTKLLKDQNFDQAVTNVPQLWRLFFKDISKVIHNPIIDGYAKKPDIYVQDNILDKWSKTKNYAHLEIALAAYYYAHTSSNDAFTHAAEEIDKAFLGKPFEELFGAPAPTTEEEASEIEYAYRARKSNEAQFDVSAPKTDEDAETLFGVLEGENNSAHKRSKRNWLHPKWLRQLATVVSAILVMGTTSLVVGWPREQTNLFLSYVAVKILPYHNTSREFSGGLDYQINPKGLVERFRTQAGMALLHELYNRNSTFAAGMLGSRYRHGYFVKKDTVKALQYLHFAERANEPRALGVLANMITSGDKIDSIERTDEEIIEYSNELLERAIEVDVTPQTRLPIAAAQNSLGWSYRLGVAFLRISTKLSSSSTWLLRMDRPLLSTILVPCTPPV